MLILTLYSKIFCCLKEGRWIFFFVAVFNLRAKQLKGRGDIFLKTRGERKREKDSGQNQQCWIDKYLVLEFFTITLQMFIGFVLTFLFYFN